MSKAIKHKIILVWWSLAQSNT